MLYMDYAANTPVDDRVLDIFCNISKEYIANPNSNYALGKNAAQRLVQSKENIARLLNLKNEEIIFTSGASESNNLAIKGIAAKYKAYGKHIITTFLEHSSVIGPISALQNEGFEVDYANILPNGKVDLEHLQELLREDTILVSISYVDSEIGLIQDIPQIGSLLKNHPHSFFHVDATQAIGKIPVDMENVDLLSFAPHKFYGLNGSGVLIKKEHVLLEPQIHGGISTTPFRSGTPALALAVSTETALQIAIDEMQSRYDAVQTLNHKLRDFFRKFPAIKINSTAHSVPHILNISIKGVSSMEIQKDLEDFEIYVATKSACCAPNTVSRPVYALTKDKKAALSTLRISLSHLTTEEELSYFMECFEKSINHRIKQRL